MAEKARANERIPIREIGPQEKDEETINLVTQLAKAIVIEPPDDLSSLPNTKPIDEKIKQIVYKDVPEPGKLSIEELRKVLFLNNTDPNKYTVSYWAKVFSMDPQIFRTIISYVAFPVPDQKKLETIAVLNFTDVESKMTLEQIEDMHTKMNIKLLGSGTENSLEEAEEEIKLIESNPTTNFKKILENDKVLKNLDKEFAELSKHEKSSENTHHILNQK